MLSKKILFVAIACMLFLSISSAQTEWDIPEETKQHLSIREFDETFSAEGQSIYDNSCLACHGNPSMGNYSLMEPAPGDPAESMFQNQTDGELYYKIQKGKGTMPGFEDILSEDELWSLVAFIRSFNSEYVQERPSMEGIEIPEYELSLNYDENVDKLVIKVSSDELPVEQAQVTAFIKGMFGNHSLGKKSTNEAGIAYFDIDSKMPGDSLGNLTITAKVSKGYGSAKLTKKLIVVEPTYKSSAIEGRHLWSVSKKAPIWLKLGFLLIIIGVWGTIFYILLGLRKIKKFS